MEDHYDSGDTFYGLERIVEGKAAMLVHMNNAIEEMNRRGFKRNVSKRKFGQPDGIFEMLYKHVWLADTFFSDTLDTLLLLELFRAAAAHNAPCRILFLNPFSDQARVRSTMLGAEEAKQKKLRQIELTSSQRRLLEVSERWPELERNRLERDKALNAILPTTLKRTLVGLESLAGALSGLEEHGRARFGGGEQPVSDNEIRGCLQIILDHLDKLLTRWSHERASLQLEVRFTSELLVLPIYIVGCYIYRGILMPRTSAVEKPWSIYRDDPSRSDDMYELTREAFQQAWDGSISLRDMRSLLQEDNQQQANANRRVIMVAYSDDNKWALDQVVRVLGDTRPDIKIERFPMAVSTGEVPKETIGKMLDSASAGIALMLHDEEIGTVTRRRGNREEKSRRIRSRPNVIHELGLMEGRFGFARVLHIVENSNGNYERPTNISGITEERINVDPHRNAFDEKQLRGVLANFVAMLGL